MKIKIISRSASNYAGEKSIRENFLSDLQKVLDSGGQIVSIVSDDVRFKKAYVLTPD